MLEKKFKNKKLIAGVLISIILVSSYAPFIADYINKLNLINNENEITDGIYDPNLAYYLYENNVSKSEYSFNAEEECFILVEIKDIDFTWFVLDGYIYNVSYGLNIIPVDFENPLEPHQILINSSNLDYFKSITVEPLFLAEGTLETLLCQDKEVNIQAGGPISILVRPTFAYNWLYIELKNANG